MQQYTILLSDDDPRFRQAAKLSLLGEPYQFIEAGTLKETWELIQASQPDLLVLDVHFKGEGTSLGLLSKMKEEGVSIPTVMLSGAASAAEAAQAIRMGAHDFLEKPISEERLRLTIDRTLGFMRLKSAVSALKPQIGSQLLGDSQALAQVRRLIQQYAGRDVKVLITGETGTGKEVVASSIWKASSRADSPFIVVNASAIPDNLVESELFGHKKGAFTGATADQTGKIELADGGTLFLDEIGDLPLASQTKLLRFLETGEIQKLGGQKARRVDVRVIAATSWELERETEKGRFRADLFYRLNVGRIHIPPLRDRLEDVSVLFLYFIKSICQKIGEPTPEVSAEALELLKDYRWPGNVRELRNAAERCLAHATGEINHYVVKAILNIGEPRQKAAAKLSPFDHLLHEYDGWMSLKKFKENAEKVYIEAVLQSLQGNITKAAAVLEIERSYLHQKIARLGIIKLKGEDGS